MDKIEKLEKLLPSQFKRLIGVYRETFDEMVTVYKSYLTEKALAGGIGGRKPKLTPPEQVLFMLEYYREYRSLAHMAFDYGISEATGSRLVKKVELALIKSGRFSLPAKKAFLDEGIDLSLAIVDVTELSIERPKKNSKTTIQEKRNTIQ